MKLITLLTSFFLSLAAVSALASNDSPLRDAGIARGLQLAGVDDPDARKVYIVQLRSPSAAVYHSTLHKPAATVAVQKTARTRFDKASPAIASYAEKLRAEQDELLMQAAPDARKIYSYLYGFNGFAAEMTAAQAHKLENMPQVLHVWEDEIRPLATNFSPGFLGLFDSDGGLRGPESVRQRGADGDARPLVGAEPVVEGEAVEPEPDHRVEQLRVHGRGRSGRGRGSRDGAGAHGRPPRRG